MGQTTAVSMEEYLRTSYPDGDREYVDGQVRERNRGEIQHADLQGRVYRLLWHRRPDDWIGLATRVQVSASRFRVPDICLVRGGKPDTGYVRDAPALAVEVLSPDDRVGEVLEKVDDYLRMGVPCVWVLNPWKLWADIHTRDGVQHVQDGVLTTPDGDIALGFDDVFRGR